MDFVTLNKDVFEKNRNKVIIITSTDDNGNSIKCDIIDLTKIASLKYDNDGVLTLYGYNNNILYEYKFADKKLAKEKYEQIYSILTSSKTE